MSDDSYPIPQSNALRQASHKSIQELFSMDPESEEYDNMQVVLHMHDLRDRLAATETIRNARVKRDPPTPAAPPRTITSAAQLGLTKRPLQQ